MVESWLTVHPTTELQFTSAYLHSVMIQSRATIWLHNLQSCNEQCLILYFLMALWSLALLYFPKNAYSIAYIMTVIVDSLTWGVCQSKAGIHILSPDSTEDCTALTPPAVCPMGRQAYSRCSFEKPRSPQWPSNNFQWPGQKRNTVR